MDRYLMDFDDFLGKKVLITSFSSGSLIGTLTDCMDDYIELEIDGEYIPVPIEPIRNIRVVEE